MCTRRSRRSRRVHFGKPTRAKMIDADMSHWLHRKPLPLHLWLFSDCCSLALLACIKNSLRADIYFMSEWNLWKETRKDYEVQEILALSSTEDEVGRAVAGRTRHKPTRATVLLFLFSYQILMKWRKIRNIDSLGVKLDQCQFFEKTEESFVLADIFAAILFYYF